MNDTPTPDVQDGEEIESLGVVDKISDLWRGEFSNLRWSVLFCTLLMRLLPEGRATGMRTNLLRAIGADVGIGTRLLGTPVLQSQWRSRTRPQLRIGANCTVGRGVILEFGESITIGDRVTLGDRTAIITTTHQLGPRTFRAGPVIRTPVSIGNDVTIGANSIVLPGAVIGDHARVMPDSVVNGKVATGLTVAGIPARPQRAAGQA